MIFQSKDQVILGRVLSGLLAIVSFANTWNNFRRVKKLTGMYFPVPYISKAVYGFASVFGVAEVLNAFELFGRENVITVYELAILHALLLQSFFFVRLFYWSLANAKN